MALAYSSLCREVLLKQHIIFRVSQGDTCIIIPKDKQKKRNSCKLDGSPLNPLKAKKTETNIVECNKSVAQVSLSTSSTSAYLGVQLNLQIISDNNFDYGDLYD